MPRSTFLSGADEAAVREARWSRFWTLVQSGDYEIHLGTNGCMWLTPRRLAAPTVPPEETPSVGTVLAEGLKKVTYEESRSHEHFVEKVCAICLDGFVDGVVLTKSPCSHVFHGHCLALWFDLRSPAICPLCRSPIT